jgi:hypothetical protein
MKRTPHKTIGRLFTVPNTILGYELTHRAVINDNLIAYGFYLNE